MGFFKKKEPNVVWRDKKGNLVCPGDACPAECDDSCPIWNNTMGLQLMSLGHAEKARDEFLKAIEIAPDFADAYNNLGCLYGSYNNHGEARRYFLKALSIRNIYPNAMNSLIVAEKNLGLYDAALEHCDEYDQYPDCDATELREKVLSAKINNSYVDYAEYLLTLANKLKIIKSTRVVNLPELMDLGDSAFPQLSNKLRDMFPASGQGEQYINTLLAWAAYLGICASYLWTNDKNSLMAQGLYEASTSHFGLEEMDEFAMNSVGVRFGSLEEQAFTEYLRAVSGKMFVEVVENGADAIWLIIRAMFLLGETYGFEKIK